MPGQSTSKEIISGIISFMETGMQDHQIQVNPKQGLRVHSS